MAAICHGDTFIDLTNEVRQRPIMFQLLLSVSPLSALLVVTSNMYNSVITVVEFLGVSGEIQ